tara:strand:+ start:178 stop:423 length:246 start_codon:yes stop_codon:yes gene_type:complete
MKLLFEAGDKIYYTTDYGETGKLARVVDVYEDKNEYLIEIELQYWNINNNDTEEEDGYGFETELKTVSSKHVHSRDMLEDW